MGKNLVLVNPQWQGGGEVCCYDGAYEISNMYLSDVGHFIVPVTRDSSSLSSRYNIIGYDSIIEQTLKARDIIRRKKPEKIFTLGGSCDGDLASIYYLDKLYKGDVFYLWVDAHGDINSADESVTHLFYGMPIRALIGGFEDTFGELFPEPMKAEQFMNVGGRDFDPPEDAFFEKNNMTHIYVDNSPAVLGKVRDAIKASGKKYVYVHMDLDVLEPTEFNYYPLPAKDGFKFETVYSILNMIKDEFDMVGFSLYEFSGAGKRLEVMDKLIEYGKNVIS